MNENEHNLLSEAVEEKDCSEAAVSGDTDAAQTDIASDENASAKDSLTDTENADAFEVSEAEEKQFGDVVLEAVGLTKTYKRRHNGKVSTLYALRDVGFSVRAGEVVGFLGPNGAGKSTAIKLVTGLASMDGGEVRILGHDVKKDRKAALREVGGVIESPDLYLNMSAIELMRYFAGLYPDEVFADAGDAGESVKEKKARRVEKLLRLVGLFDRKDDKIKTYSLGMKQRLGIAQALINRPKLLLLDEPANGLDPAGIKEIRDIVKKLAADLGMAVLVSSHQLAEMEQMCDKVVILYKGQKAAEGVLSELTEKVSKRRVHIKTAEARRAAELFEGRSNVTAIVEQGGILLSGDITAGDAAKELVLNGIPISGVGEDTGNLEELFFRLTKEGGAL